MKNDCKRILYPALKTKTWHSLIVIAKLHMPPASLLYRLFWSEPDVLPHLTELSCNHEHATTIWKGICLSNLASQALQLTETSTSRTDNAAEYRVSVTSLYVKCWTQLCSSWILSSAVIEPLTYLTGTAWLMTERWFQTCWLYLMWRLVLSIFPRIGIYTLYRRPKRMH